MPKIRVRTVIDAPRRVVWDEIADISTHVEWMADAVAIRFHDDQRSGVGTTFDCETRVGPISLTDEMVVTEWKPRRAMGVRHVGLVSGEGVFTLRRRRGGRTEFVWQERLSFPWWLGGPVGGAIGAPVLRWIWKRNLRRLKAIVESR